MGAAIRAPGVNGSKREKRGEGRGPQGALGCGVCSAGEGEVGRVRGEKKQARGAGWVCLSFFSFSVFFLFSFSKKYFLHRILCTNYF